MAENTEPSSSSSVPRTAADAGIIQDHGISINLPDSVTHGRPAAVKHMSLPAYQSPLRHHTRTHSRTNHVKESLNARSHYSSSDDDGTAVHRINQYIIKQEIGRGSFGAVHLAIDQYGTEYAVKEFSKSRLRKRAQSNLLRRPNQKHPSHLAARLGYNSPLHRLSSMDKANQNNDHALDLIKEEIAIMKKLNHNNVASLIEVLDDPEEDSLYMVLEMCKKGVVMKVGLGENAEPYEEETCRCWFRDMILGMEYLHAQGIIHRDIKPDNCLITQDDVLKIVDFGVSEMFEKESDMSIAKSAGSPAFMPPELCVAKHGQVSGRAADIWSMGVTLYCLRYGQIPFEKYSMLEMYEAIRNDEFDLHGEPNHDFANLMHSLLEKDPEKRITMQQLREHPWVTKGGSDPLLSAEENCADLIELPTEAELQNAITGNMKQLLVVMKAVKRFKDLLFKKRPELMSGIFGRSSRFVAPPADMRPVSEHRHAQSADSSNRRPLERILATEGVHHDIVVSDDNVCRPRGVDIKDSAGTGSDNHEDLLKGKHYDTSSSTSLSITDSLSSRDPTMIDRAKGHAHDPLTDLLFLDIGPGLDSQSTGQVGDHFLSESPGATEMNVYETAYEEEMKRILERRGREPTIYLTRRVEDIQSIRDHESVIGRTVFNNASSGLASSGLANLAQKVKARHREENGEEDTSEDQN
ncbi:hypothetical protein AAFC00_002907 [Neodothiora populina]|uniref:Protein kinase domain-containing protein n=1 Tax=Neodothiora populina TaxID=2781224 RepID=A0ABR3P8M2_9PEZI